MVNRFSYDLKLLLIEELNCELQIVTFGLLSAAKRRLCQVEVEWLHVTSYVSWDNG